MPEIQSVANLELFKYIIGVLIGLVNVLIVVIAKNFKGEFNKLKFRCDKDHDRLDRIETAHNIFHPNIGG